MNEFRVFGPPGTGKTTYLSRQIGRAVKKYGPDAVVATSFTRAAAQELAGRDLPIPLEQVGTIHSLCYHALGKPKIAETVIKEWNQEYPQWKLTSRSGFNLDNGEDDAEFGKTRGDQLYHQMQILRAQMIHPSTWSRELQGFYQDWIDFKSETDTVDFTDLIEKVYCRGFSAPGNPKVGFVDEAQDSTPLILSLIRMWGLQMERFILVGDDDQCLYGFAGATPEAFLSPEIPDNHKIFLDQSYRVPLRIQETALHIIEGVETRQVKQYKPRNFEGDYYLHIPGSWKHPEAIVHDVEKKIQEGKSVMILGACSYMLAPTRRRLMEEGIPFGNLYRLNRGDWNPLSTKAGRAIVRGIRTFQKPGIDGPYWSVRDLVNFSEVLKTNGALVPDTARKLLKILNEYIEDGDEEVNESCRGVIEGVIDKSALSAALDRDMGWFLDHLPSGRQRLGKYVNRIVTYQGHKALTSSPKVTLGTIHSVKGGEADVVYLFPDLSNQGMAQWVKGGDGQDAIRRQFYVASTRAREELRVTWGYGRGKTPRGLWSVPT